MKDSVVILGASRGIGQEIALHLANEGYEKLILVARNLDALKALEKSVHKIQPDVSVTSYGVDLTDGSACEKFFHQLEDDGEFPKHWIFSYGGSPTGQSNRIPIERREWSNVEDVMELNLLSQMRLTARILLELLRPANESSLN